jgi:HEAT repeat protein
MAKSFRSRMNQLRDRASRTEWVEDPRDIRRRRWLADFERLLLVATNSRGLIKVARDPGVDKRVRSIAIEALGTLQSKSAVRTLLKLLQHADDTTSFQAAGALCEASQCNTVPKLLEILSKAPSWRSREGASWILHRVKGRGASAALAKAALGDAVPAVRISAVHGLITYPNRRTFKTLFEALEDPAPRVRGMAVFAVDCLSLQPGIEIVLPALRRLASHESNALLRDEARQTLRSLTRRGG